MQGIYKIHIFIMGNVVIIVNGYILLHLSFNQINLYQQYYVYNTVLDRSRAPNSNIQSTKQTQANPDKNEMMVSTRRLQMD